MKHASCATLSRRFQRILSLCVPLPAIALVACGGSATDSADAGLQGDAPGSSSGGDTGPTSDGPGTDGAVGDEGAPSDAGEVDGDGATYVVTSCGETVPVVSGPYGSRCNAQCFPLEAGAFVTGDGSPRSTQCSMLCGPGVWFSCAPETDAGTLLIRCEPDCTGRRPQGLLASRPATGAPLGAYFAEMARMEAASIAAFRHLRRELLAHRAPRRLVRAAERAARDEARHARMTTALARRHGAEAIASRVEGIPVRSLEAIAIENAVEGCVRETFGALVASWQARAACDPLIRAAMTRIAHDETRHAALAFAVDAWARGRLGPEARGRVEQARSKAITEVATRAQEAPILLRTPLGLPTSAQTRALAEGFFAQAA
jgi:hypothetical protein